MTPRGFHVHVGNAQIKDDSRDLLIVSTDVEASVAGVFTQSRFAGPSVTLSRDTVATGRSRGLVVVSKNANVANGPAGLADAVELRASAAAAIGAEPERVVVASTGVIGRRYPMDRIRRYFDGIDVAAGSATFADAAQAIMTTDTHPKLVSATAGDATIVGIAKGVGMIEPDMATLLTFFFTDAAIESSALDAMLRRVVAVTFNALSIDTDTSTSDSAVIWANGLAGPVDEHAFEAAFAGVALSLVKMIAADGEGASKLIEATVRGARDTASAKLVAKAIVNSPLVKTAVHGADPNWGRLAMAVGKCSTETDIDPDRVILSIGGIELYPTPADGQRLALVAAHMAGTEVLLEADLQIGDATFTAYGCDLTDGYIRINADYTT